MSLILSVILLLLVSVASFVSGQSAEELRTFSLKTMDRHNYYRRFHGVPDLVLNSTISETSQYWAEYLAYNKIFGHSSNQRYGENLYWSWNSVPNYKVDPNAAVDSWYAEIEYYNDGDGFSEETGHLTQMLWKASRQLGVGWAIQDNTNFVVCHYYPPGNYEGQYRDNVPPRVSYHPSQNKW